MCSLVLACVVCSVHVLRAVKTTLALMPKIGCLLVRGFAKRPGNEGAVGQARIVARRKKRQRTCVLFATPRVCRVANVCFPNSALYYLVWEISLEEDIWQEKPCKMHEQLIVTMLSELPRLRRSWDPNGGLKESHHPKEQSNEHA